jgi:GT2 family glycosyltransferase
MRVAVIIVNWNAGELLARALRSVERQSRPADRVIVVDNASTDGSLEAARPHLERTELIRLHENAGFARANNLAMTAARDCDAIALLNPDAFAEPGWLAALIEAADSAPDAAGFASRMLLDSAPDYLDGIGDTYHVSGRAWRRGHGIRDGLWAASDAEVFAPCAAAALYRRAAVEEVGGFDERYFCYFEDVDLGFRLRLRGYRSVYVYRAVVRHVSSALSGYRSDFAVYHGERNAVWTFVKNMPAPLFWLYLPQHLALNLAALAYYPLRRQGQAAWRAKLDAVRGLGAVLRDRRAVQRDRRAGSRALRSAMGRGLLQPYARRYAS